MKHEPAIVWFRRDLRVSDNEALCAACESADQVLPLFIWETENGDPWWPGAASRWWIHHSLVALGDSLRERGSRLLLRMGRASRVIGRLADDAGAKAVHWTEGLTPGERQQDRKVRAMLAGMGIEAIVHPPNLLHDPRLISTKSGDPYKVFTPFWKACLKQVDVPEPLEAPERIPAMENPLGSLSINDLELLPTKNWTEGIAEAWSPGENGAFALIGDFLKSGLEGYSDNRDVPSQPGTSRLSPHLHFGEISVREIWHRAQFMIEAGESSADAQKFLAEVGWREFAHHLLFHFPETVERPLRPEFENFPWEDNPEHLRAWQGGRTGYPIVDAGMRELWHTGWMHNRVRMIVASFLIKDLLLPWQEGAAWFWDTLVDADLANNTLGWQWSAGCGADAAPFFRVFNPVLQGEKFDKDGAYVKQWVPEIANLPKKFIHHPWDAPGSVLKEAGVELGTTYPEPIVDHTRARIHALEAFETVKSSKKS